MAIFTDRSGALDIRAAHAEAHFAYLEAHRDKIRIAGGLRNELGAPPDGGLWILDNISGREEAVQLCEADPFFVAGLRESYVLKAWGFAPCYADVVI